MKNAKSVLRKARKNKIFNWLYEELYILKIWKRNQNYKKTSLTFREETISALKENNQYKMIYFLCIPDHSNLGDQAQRWCIENWITENYPDYNLIKIYSRVFYIKEFRHAFAQYVKKDDIFIIQSGYCTTSWHPDHPVHRFIVKNFKNNKILIMPQTIRYIYKRDAYLTSRIYNQNKNLLLLVRDKVSYDYAEKKFRMTKIKLYPDIVTTLIGNYPLEQNKTRTGILFCMRNDDEKLYSDDAIKKIIEKFECSGVSCDLSDTGSNSSFLELQNTFSCEFSEMLSFFSAHKLVMTDRYHGTIFSLISNTPVIVLKTKDHKVSTGVDWLKTIYKDSVFLAENLEQAYELAQKIISENKCITNKSYFKERYYDKLKWIFEKK